MIDSRQRDPVVAPQDSRVVYSCGGCGRKSTTLAPIACTQAVLRVCDQCDARLYCADAGDQDPPACRPHAGFAPARHLPLHQRSRLRAAVATLLGDSRPGESIALPVTATPLDERYAPLGVTVAGEVSDLTEQWVRFTLPTDRHASYWLIDFGPAGYAGWQLAVGCETATPVGDGSWRVAGAPAS